MTAILPGPAPANILNMGSGGQIIVATIAAGN
jgi:hypothetical protein